MESLRDRLRQPHQPLRQPASTAPPRLKPVVRHKKQVSLQRFQLILLSFGRLLGRHKKLALSATVILILGLFAISRLSGQSTASGQPVADNTHQANTAGVLQKGTPDYPTLLPADRDISTLGGWTRVSPPNKNPVYAYTDRLKGIDISVSQQPLPKSFQPDVDVQLAETAKNFGADQSFKALSTTVYIGTSAKGPQSLLLVSGKTLILIKSSAPLSTADWANYLNTLR